MAEEAAAAPGEYAAAFEHILAEHAANAVGTKSILAYRGGFKGDLSEPAATDVVEAAARWRDAGGPPMHRPGAAALRSASGLAPRETAAVSRRARRPGLRPAHHEPHVPVGLSQGVRPHSGDAAALLSLRAEAGYLAQAFNNVFDGGLAINYLGARSAAFIGRLLEMAPFRKILYSSDGFGPAELHFLGARLWRNGIRDVVAGLRRCGRMERGGRRPGRRPDRTRQRSGRAYDLR